MLRDPRHRHVRLALLLFALPLFGCGAPDTVDLIVVDRRPHPDHGIYRLQGEAREPLFTAAPLGHVMQIAVAAERRQCVFAYTPPPNATQRAGSSLLLLDIDAPAAPRPLIAAAAGEALLDPVYAPDERTLYWVRAELTMERNPDEIVALKATDLASMTTEHLLGNAIWPAPSPDGRWLAFLSVNPTTLTRGLGLLDLRTRQVTSLIGNGAFADIDAPTFSADGQWIFFHGPPQQGALSQSHSWTDRLLALLGIAPAHAHSNMPGVWWKISVRGDGLQAVTAQPEIISNASRLRSGALAYTSSLGLRRMLGGEVDTLNAEPYFGDVADYAR